MMTTLRYRTRITGVVQGVGFRPFIHQLALDEELSGWVRNGGSSVDIEVEGSKDGLERFFIRVQRERPPLSFIESMRRDSSPLTGEKGFEIRESNSVDLDGAVLAPDAATCRQCLTEVFEASNRRYRYPFTTCTNCGPRYSITERLPFDRGNTTMKAFTMCAACRVEYLTPGNRRFHSQTNACVACGPTLELLSSEGELLGCADSALLQAAAGLRDGKIVAVKSIGGFHLMVDATSETAVARLRERKRREAKPLAVLVGSLQEAARFCAISEVEQNLFESPQAPIVLFQKSKGGTGMASGIAPRLCLYGMMCAYTPLHHLLLAEAQRPLVATSGNPSDESICFEDADAFEQLKSVADFFLTHNRRIIHGLDDSIVREIGGRPVVLRRARGYTPGVLSLPKANNENDNGLSVLAFGGHLKNTIAVAKGLRAYLSQHLGRLESPRSIARYYAEIETLPNHSGVEPAAAACDAHSDYHSTDVAEESGLPLVRVQHHYAHVLSCLADNGVRWPALGVAWDGSGYGDDETIWGGEFLQIDERGGFQRMGHIRRFRLPGSSQAVREPRRSALGVLYEILGEELFSDLPKWIKGLFDRNELSACQRMLARGLNSPLCSSAGRLFDAMAALLGLRAKCDFEGQAAMELETSAWEGCSVGSSYSVSIVKTAETYQLDWEPMLGEILSDLRRGEAVSTIAARFHLALAKGISGVAGVSGAKTVALTGGVFQNKFLTEAVIREFRASGIEPLWHRTVPPNDGGISLGQLIAARIGRRKCV